jgi:hypothetical protein
MDGRQETHLALKLFDLRFHSFDLRLQSSFLLERFEVFLLLLTLLIGEFGLIRTRVLYPFPDSFGGAIADVGPFFVFLLTSEIDRDAVSY